MTVVRTAIVVSALLTTITASAAGQATTGTGQPGDERLRERVEVRYHVLVLQDRLVLVPRSASPRAASIEIANGRVAVNGKPVTGEELKAALGAEADPIVQLSFLDAERAQEIFGPATRESPPQIEVEKREPGRERPQRSYRRTGSRVRIGGDIHVSADEIVIDPVVAVFGSVTVDGSVRDDVVAVFGHVRLNSDAEVTGDVTAVGGTVQQAAGARVGGQINEVVFGVPRIRLRWHDVDFGFVDSAWLAPLRLVGTLLRFAIIGLLAAFVVLVAREPIGRIERELTSEPWKSGLVGLLAQLMFLPLMILAAVILAISIVGIPLLVVLPFAVLALLLAFLVGFTAVGYGLGRWVCRRLGRVDATPLGALAVGLALVWALMLAGRLTWLGGWPVGPGAAIVLAIGFLIEYAAWTVGLGAALLTRFGTRPTTVQAGPLASPAGGPDPSFRPTTA